MQCSACSAVYSNGLDSCPRCKTPATPGKDQSESPENTTTFTSEGTPESPAKPASRLIEFPGTARGSRPLWRKELSDKVREVQERRAREAAHEAEEFERIQQDHPDPLLEGASLGLVPNPDQPEVNPIVAAALRRIQRAQRPQQHRQPRATARGAAAVARVAEEYAPKPSTMLRTNPAITATKPQTEPARDRVLSVVAMDAAPMRAPEKVEVPVAKKPATVVRESVNEPRVESATITSATASGVATAKAAPARYASVIEAKDDLTLGEMEAELLAEEFADSYDDGASAVARIPAAITDLLCIVFFASPFAAIIELSDGSWMDDRVLASMGAILLAVAFIYLSFSVTLSGRTWGMSMLSLRVIDAASGLRPTTKQAAVRAVFYMISLAMAGLPLLYALVDADGRTAHDHLSGTVVIHE